MLTSPSIVVNCDTCPRSLVVFGWSSKETVIDYLREQGWHVAPVKVETQTNPTHCVECAGKGK